MDRMNVQAALTKSKAAIFRGVKMAEFGLSYVQTRSELSTVLQEDFSGSFRDAGVKKFATAFFVVVALIELVVRLVAGGETLPSSVADLLRVLGGIAVNLLGDKRRELIRASLQYKSRFVRCMYLHCEHWKT